MCMIGGGREGSPGESISPSITRTCTCMYVYTMNLVVCTIWVDYVVCTIWVDYVVCTNWVYFEKVEFNTGEVK